MSGPPLRRRLLGLLLFLSAAVGSTAAADPRIAFVPTTPRPGDLVLIRVVGVSGDLTGEWAGQALRFFPVPEGMAALAGVDLEVRQGPITWRVTRPTAERAPEVVGEGALPLEPRAFATQRLTLPREQVDLDTKTLARVRGERAALQAALAGSAGERLWRGAFRVPVEEGTPTGGFGLRRIINGQSRSPHAGADWAAPRGTPVLAANAGRIAFVAEHFFAGRSVVLDHGLGLFTLYFHLDETLVAPGDGVRRGQPIGRVGATGRVTGPHLHFAVLLDGARIDPDALLGLFSPE